MRHKKLPTFELWSAREKENARLYEQANRLVRRLRNSPKIWEDDDTKIRRVLGKAKARSARRYDLPGPHRRVKRDYMLTAYA